MYNEQKKKGEILIREAPERFKLEDTTIWSFPERGNWATHSGKYRGNWSPYIPRNIILRYSKKKDWILDQFLGSGTTLIEAKLLGRNAIGVDINSEAVKLSNTNLNFTCQEKSKIFTKQGNANNLSNASAAPFLVENGVGYDLNFFVTVFSCISTPFQSRARPSTK